ncbi:MAG: type II toxin-antitoxin system Phd/YefM family antitoxin [Chloroflexi bacterium]|nr:type II toxin-antitoxin system Phd/YefM family antitoxin [Chloroflexota bacterium]
MSEAQISIGQVKRDFELVNRVAFGGERIVLTSRGKPKAVLVSLEDYRSGFRSPMNRRGWTNGRRSIQNGKPTRPNHGPARWRAT